jgi:hypothetical protein
VRQVDENEVEQAFLEVEVAEIDLDHWEAHWSCAPGRFHVINGDSPGDVRSAMKSVIRRCLGGQHSVR